jgi:hypothetical protein
MPFTLNCITNRGVMIGFPLLGRGNAELLLCISDKHEQLALTEYDVHPVIHDANTQNSQRRSLQLIKLICDRLINSTSAKHKTNYTRENPYLDGLI